MKCFTSLRSQQCVHSHFICHLFRCNSCTKITFKCKIFFYLFGILKCERDRCDCIQFGHLAHFFRQILLRMNVDPFDNQIFHFHVKNFNKVHRVNICIGHAFSKELFTVSNAAISLTEKKNIDLVARWFTFNLGCRGKENDFLFYVKIAFLDAFIPKLAEKKKKTDFKLILTPD